MGLSRTPHTPSRARRSRRLGLSLLLAGALALTACAKDDSGDSVAGGGGSGSTARLGVIVAETGPLAGAGRTFLNGAMTAAELINSDDLVGNGLKVELVKKEGSEDPAKTAGVAAQLAADKSIVGLACCILSPVAGAVAPVAKAQKVPLVLWGATQLGLEEPPYVLRTTTMPQQANEVIGKSVAEKQGIKTVAYNVMTDNAGIVSQAAAFKKGLDAAGVKDLGQVGTLGKQADFNGAAATLMEKKPDAIVVSATQAESVAMIATLHDKGYAGQIITGQTILGTGVFASQPEALEDAPFPVYFLAAEATGLGKKFVESYEKAFGQKPDDYAAQGFNAIHTMAMALKDGRGEPTRESLTEGLNGLKSLKDTIYGGEVTFMNGQLDASSSVKIVHYTKPDGALALWEGP